MAARRTARQRAASRRNLVNARRKRIAKGVLTVGVAAGAVYGGHRLSGGHIDVFTERAPKGYRKSMYGMRKRKIGRTYIARGNRLFKTGNVKRTTVVRGRNSITFDYARGATGRVNRAAHKESKAIRQIMREEGRRSSRKVTAYTTAKIFVRGR